MNILRNLDTTCITNQMWRVRDVPLVKPISLQHCWWRLFEASFQLKLKFYLQER